jgi:hypothetical protein
VLVSLPVVLCVPERQVDRARALVDYCSHELNQTEIQVIVMTQEEDESFQAQYPENRFHSLQSYGLHRAAVWADGPFIWLEADAVPLRPDWALVLEGEYERALADGKKFLISSDSNPPFDLVGGIGCYPEETEWLVPCQFPKSSWDRWLIEAVPHLVARTPLIQHSYGIYNSLGFAVEHRFPRDNKMLRKEAVLFHRDPFHDLFFGSVKN